MSGSNEGWSDKQVRAKIERLQRLVDIVRQTPHPQSRPLVVEFSGLPKAGKTTAIQSLAMFLRRNRIPVKVITEQASLCPIPSKESANFNAWTACQSLCHLLSAISEPAVSDEPRIVIIDRGLYDALIWFRLHHKEGRLSQEELETIEAFLLLPTWRERIDLVIFMKTTPEKAIEREFRDLLTDKPGAIMNQEFLGKWLQVAKEVKAKYDRTFRRFKEIVTTDLDVKDGVERVTKTVLDVLTDERLVVVPRSKLEDVMTDPARLGTAEDYRFLEAVVGSTGTAMLRTAAEDDDTQVQIVACGVFVHRSSSGQSALLFRKRKSRRGDSLGHRTMLWAGGHVRWSDWGSEQDLTKAAAECLHRELREELGFQSEFDIKLLGVAYDRTNSRSLQHIGLMFEIVLDDPELIVEMHNGVYAEHASQEQEVFLEFVHSSIVTRYPEMEAWSRQLLRTSFGLDIPHAVQDLQMRVL